MKIWTYTFIDLDMVRDDPQCAESVMPTQAWKDRASAEAAMQREVDLQLDEAFEDEPYNRPLVRVDDLKWHDAHSGEMKRWESFVEEVNSWFYLYEMEVL